MNGGEPTELRRTLGTFSLTLYGVGVIVGAGIFVLVGEIVGRAGPAGWLAFIGAAAAALPTGLAYAELASRYPRSAGEALFASRAFGRSDVSFMVGFLVVASGVMSTAAVSHGFAAYVDALVGQVDVPRGVVVVVFLAGLSLIIDRGIRHATWVNALCTSLSVAALLAIVVAGIPQWGSSEPPLVRASLEVPPGAALGAIALAFYAFIGFEDICNVAEETRNPSKTIPRAILLSLAISTALYALVTFTALSVARADALAQHPAPLAMVAERVLPGVPSHWLSIVALLAVTNTALFNLVMTSRVVYGMARNGWLPHSLGRVDERTRTPRLGVLLAFVLASLFAVTGVLRVLAEATNVIILLAFTAVNASLVAVRARKVPADPDAGAVFRVPIAVPIAGMLVTVVLLTRLSPGAYARAAVLIALGVVVHLAVRRRSQGDRNDA